MKGQNQANGTFAWFWFFIKPGAVCSLKKWKKYNHVICSLNDMDGFRLYVSPALHCEFGVK